MDNETDVTILFRILVLGISLSHADQAFLLGNVSCPLVSVMMTVAQEGSPSKERSP